MTGGLSTVTVRNRYADLPCAESESFTQSAARATERRPSGWSVKP